MVEVGETHIGLRLETWSSQSTVVPYSRAISLVYNLRPAIYICESECVSYFNHFVLHHTPISDPARTGRQLSNGSPDIFSCSFCAMPFLS